MYRQAGEQRWADRSQALSDHTQDRLKGMLAAAVGSCCNPCGCCLLMLALVGAVCTSCVCLQQPTSSMRADNSSLCFVVIQSVTQAVLCPNRSV